MHSGTHGDGRKHGNQGAATEVTLHVVIIIIIINIIIIILIILIIKHNTRSVNVHVNLLLCWQP
jgi:uncharacterized integral membrane protein